MTARGSRREARRHTEELLGFIRSYVATHGFGPTVREIGLAMGMSSTSVVSYHLAILESEGRIRRARGKARTLQIVS